MAVGGSKGLSFYYYFFFHHTFRHGHTQKLFPWEEKQKDKASAKHLTALQRVAWLSG